MLSLANKQSPNTKPELLDQLALMATLCKASSDPLRLQVLRVLKNESFGVSELCAIFEIPQPALSHHLKVLAGAGLVATRREGNSIFYRRSELGQGGELGALKSQIFDTVDDISLPLATHNAMAAMYGQREANSRSFFALNAHKFQQQQDLIASYSQYAETVAQLLGDAPLSSHQLALEVGPGDGSFLKALSPQFKHIIALDNAEKMLARARNSAADAGLDNITFIHGDTTAPELKNLAADCIIINMVLHHTPSPAQIFMDMASCLAPGGVLLVTDLCSHDQGWARENCGDLWLGFEPQNLTKWAGDAGLADITSVYLAQRNGFQIQVRLFGHPQQTTSTVKR